MPVVNPPIRQSTGSTAFSTHLDSISRKRSSRNDGRRYGPSANAIFPPSRTDLNIFARGYCYCMANLCRRYGGHGYHGSDHAARNRFGAGGVVDAVPEPFRMHYPCLRIDGLVMGLGVL
jgi:hypothetical protein